MQDKKNLVNKNVQESVQNKEEAKTLWERTQLRDDERRFKEKKTWLQKELLHKLGSKNNNKCMIIWTQEKARRRFIV